MRNYKVFSQVVFVVLLLLVGLSLALPAHLIAEESDKFFDKNVAVKYFDSGIRDKEGGFKMLPSKRVRPIVEAPNANIKDKTENTQEGSEVVPSNAANPLKTSEDIVRAFGDPEKDTPVKAQDNAPLPFKCLMAAIEIGDDILAKKCARQFVRYQRRVQGNVMAAVGYMGKGMEDEGILSESGWSGDQRFSAYQGNAKANAFIEKANQEEDQQLESSDSEKNIQPKPPASKEELLMRAKVRQQILSKEKAKPDAKGEVDIYFFMRPNDKDSQYMATTIQELYRTYKGNQKVRLAGLTLELETEGLVAAYRQKTGAKFPIKNGSVLAKSLGVKSAPTIVFVSRSTGHAILEGGVRPQMYLEEMVRIITGK